MITGEPIPVEKRQGRPGHRWQRSTGRKFYLMRAERVGSDTLLAQIVRMVAEAQRSRAPIQKLADIVAGYFVPAVVLVAVVTFIVWALVGPEPRDGLCADQCGGSPDHCLPVRTGSCNSHVDHGRRRDTARRRVF